MDDRRIHNHLTVIVVMERDGVVQGRGWNPVGVGVGWVFCGYPLGTHYPQGLGGYGYQWVVGICAGQDPCAVLQSCPRPLGVVES